MEDISDCVALGYFENHGYYNYNIYMRVEM